MRGVAVDARMPNRNYVEPGNVDRGLELHQSSIGCRQQARRNDRDEIVGLEHVR